MTNIICYWLMDGRAAYDIDEAAVLHVCDTLEQAEAEINDYGADTCIVEISDDRGQQLIRCREP
jgi:hypothetical protein